MPLALFKSVESQARDGSRVQGVDINEIKKHVAGYWLAPSGVTPDANPLVLAAGGQVDLHFTVDPQGHFDWAYIVGVSTGRYSLKFFDGGRNRFLQNMPVLNELIVGTSFRPLMLPKSYFLDVGNSSREVICTVKDLSGSTNTIWLSLYGRRFYHKEMPFGLARDVSRKFFDEGPDYSYFLVPKETSLQGDLDAVAAGAEFALTFEADDDANIEIQKIIGSEDWADSIDNVTIRERDTLRGLNSAPAGAGIIAGSSINATPAYPVYWPDSYLLQRKKQLLVTGRNATGAALKPFLMMAGRRFPHRTEG